MRIGIDAFPLMQAQGGVGSYTRHLLKALLDLKSTEEFVGYVPMHSLRAGQFKGWESSSPLRWVEVRQPFFRCRGWLDNLDLYHGTNFKAQTKGRYGTILTLHDLWLDRYPEYSKKIFGQRASFYRTRRRAWKAARVVTVSRYSAMDIEDIYGLPRERISIVPNGVSGEFYQDLDESRLSEMRARHRIPSASYILFLGGADPRKNHSLLLQAFARHPILRKSHYLVLVGDPSHPFGNVSETSRILGISERVVCLSAVSVHDLRLLYSYADMFVFPSRYEGFGIPVLEAMACGAPVITSNTTALPEVAGDAAVLINPEDPVELGEAMSQVLQDSSLRTTLRSRGFERARQFTWERAAERTLAVYREVCGHWSC